MNRFKLFRRICFAILIVFNIVMLILAFNPGFQHWWEQRSFWEFMAFPLFDLFLIIFTIDIGGKYVLYLYFFIASYLVSAGVGWTAGYRGEWAVVETALTISIPSFFLLVICIVILIRRHHRKRRDTHL